jgi:hypothetical protein
VAVQPDSQKTVHRTEAMVVRRLRRATIARAPSL